MLSSSQTTFLQHLEVSKAATQPLKKCTYMSKVGQKSLFWLVLVRFRHKSTAHVYL